MVNNIENNIIKDETAIENISNIDIESYVIKVMLELGLRPDLLGFDLFKDGVIYILKNKEEESFWTKIIYPHLGKKYFLNGARVERNLRTIIEKRTKKNTNNEVYKYIFGDDKNISVSECIKKIAKYIETKIQNEYLVEKITKINEEIYQDNINTSNNQLDKQIDYILNKLGILPEIKGYKYLKDAIIYLLLNNEEPIIWTNLYSKIAKPNNITSNLLERQISNIINLGCENHPNNKLSEYVYQEKTHIYVSEFISSITNYINQVEKNQTTEVTENTINMSLEQRVNHTIHFLGIPSSIRGYYYIKDAVLYVLRNENLTSWIDVYNEVASINNSNYTNTERIIRHAISKWIEQYQDMTKEELIDSRASDATKFIHKYGTKFINSEFIALLATYIKLTSEEYRREKNIQQTNKQLLRKII